MYKRLLTYSAVIFMLYSCGSTKEISYFQDISEKEAYEITNTYTNVIKSGDLLSIVVSSTQPELALPFNLYSVRTQMNTAPVTGSNARQEMEGYTVNTRGDIDFPVLGAIHAEGMTREQLAETLKNRLLQVLPDPIVTVNFLNFKVTVIGEVNKPGTFNIYGDRISILEAIGMAGDLSIYGKRAQVLVIRENDGMRSTERLDLKSKKIFLSQYFYLQQNDVVYVEPIEARARSVSPFVNNLPLITSVGSLAASIAMVIFYFSTK